MAQCNQMPVQCDTSLLVCCSPLEARQVPMHGYLQTGNTNRNSLWKQWLPDFALCLVLWGLSGEIWHDIYHNALALEQVLYVLKCSFMARARSGATTQATALLYFTLLLWSCQAERRLSLAVLTKLRMVSSKYNFIFSTSVSS